MLKLIIICLQNEFQDQIKGQKNYESIANNIALANIQNGTGLWETAAIVIAA